MLRCVKKSGDLDSIESFLIYKNREKLMNSDNGPIAEAIFGRCFHQNK